MRKLNKLFTKLVATEFYRNIISLFTGMFVARLVPFAFALVIARLYAPSDFGAFVLFLTIGSVLSIVSTGKYEKALILAESEEERKHLFRVSQKINILVNLLTVLVLIPIVFFTQPAKDKLILYFLVPFYSYFFGSIQLIRNIFICQKQFNKLSFLEILRSLLTGVLQCLFFIFPGTGLFLGVVLAQGIIYFIYTYKIKEAVYFILPPFSPDEQKLAKRYINFPKFSIASEVLNFSSSQLPIFMFKPFFGDTMLGLYSFSHRYISVPVQLLSVSISSVYIQNAQSLINTPNELSKVTFSLFKRKIQLGILPFTILGLWGEQIFRFVFGSEWEFSGYLAQIIAPWLFVVMIGSPLSSILVIKEKQKVSMWYNILLLIARGASLLAGALIFKDIITTVVLYSIAGFSFFIFLTGYSLWLAGVDLKKAVIFVVKTALLILPLVIFKIWF